MLLLGLGLLVSRSAGGCGGGVFVGGVVLAGVVAVGGLGVGVVVSVGLMKVLLV